MSRCKSISIILFLAITFGCLANESQITKNADSYYSVTLVPIQDKININIDGCLEDTDWGKAHAINSFQHFNGGTLENNTQVKLITDGEYLYVGFTCYENRMKELKRNVYQHDGPVWLDDCVEIFLDSTRNRTSYGHYILSASEAKYDAIGRDFFGWNPQWEGKVGLFSNYWVAEIKIPLGSVADSQISSGDIWLGNFCRGQQLSKELSAWIPTFGPFASPNKFGEIVFGNFYDASIKLINKIDGEIDGASKEVAVLGDETLAERLMLLSANANSYKQLLTPQMKEKEFLEFKKVFRELEHEFELINIEKFNRITKNTGYIIWQKPAFATYSPKIHPGSIQPTPCSINERLIMGQTENCTLMVANLSNETLEAFVNPVIDYSGLDLFFPTFVRTGDDRPVPDALVPADNLNRIIVPPGEQREIWLSIKGVEPGTYEGYVEITPIMGSKVDWQIPLTIQVEDIDVSGFLPDSYTWNYLGDAQKYNIKEQVIDNLAEHHINYYTIQGVRILPRPSADDEGNFTVELDWTLLQQELEDIYKNEKDVVLYVSLDIWEKSVVRPIFNNNYDSIGWEAAFKKWISEMLSQLQAFGLTYDDFIINPVDESPDYRYIKLARLIREVDPNVRLIANTIAPLKEMEALDPYVDIYMPHYRTLPDPSYSESLGFIINTGKPVGFYFYSEGSNEKAENPYTRYLWCFWYAHQFGLRKGPFGYWAATQFYGDVWNRHKNPTNYDPALIYPGNGIVINSSRWEAWKRGLEDIALLEAVESTINSEPDEKLKKKWEKAYEDTINLVIAHSADSSIAKEQRQKLIDILVGTGNEAE